MIWTRPVALNDLNALSGGLTAHLGIVFTEIGDDFVRATMPVTPQHHQPMGLLHGGANVALAETLGSVGGALSCGEGKTCVGLEINANHVRAVRNGTVVGTARPLHRGATTHVWEIRIDDEAGRLVCISRLTLAVVQRRA